MCPTSRVITIKFPQIVLFYLKQKKEAEQKKQKQKNISSIKETRQKSLNFNDKCAFVALALAEITPK